MSDPRELKERVAERLLALDGVHAVLELGLHLSTRLHDDAAGRWLLHGPPP